MKWTVSPSVCHYDFKDTLYLLEADSGKMYGTKGLGRALVLLLLKQPVESESLAEALVKLYQIDRKKALEDVESFLNSAKVNALIEEFGGGER